MEKFLYERLENKTPKINLWFAYPAIESFAMASLGYLTIFQMFDSDPELYTERVYTDSKTTNINPDFVDAMGFSVSFELDILNIIKMLKKYNFPLKYEERKENDPIIFAGGPVMMSNPVPYEDFFDFISIGEKTCLLGALEILKKKRELPRDEILKRLSEVEGIYVAKYKKEKVKIVRDDIKNNVVYTPILSSKSYFENTFIIELERGCPRMCNFCLASWLNLPVRYGEYDQIIKAIDLGLKYTNKLALLGAYVAGHPKFNDIISYISKKCAISPVELSISSLRADLADENLIKTLIKCNQKTATIALEAGSQRLRDYIGKNLTKEQILNTLNTAQICGLKGMKIYTMIGLPEETDEDIEELIELSKEIKKQIKKNKTPFDITISTSTFIPKAHTPFERVERCDNKTLEKRAQYLKKNLHKLGFNFRCSSIEWDTIQAILSRYDKSLADFLIKVVEKGGNIGAFKQTWREENKKEHLMDFNECSKLPFDNIEAKNLTWGFIDTSNASLKKKRQNCLK